MSYQRAAAHKDYEPGDVIVSEDHPVVHILYQEYKFLHCDECFSKSLPVKKCTGCRRMAYCSRSCQATNWQGGHRWECPIFQAAAASSRTAQDFFGLDGQDGDSERFLLRVWLLFKNQSSKLLTEATLPTGHTRRFSDLMSNSDHYAVDRAATAYFRDNLLPLFNRYSLLSNTAQDQRDLFTIMGKLRTNAFGIADSYGLNERPLGGGLYLIGCVYDHSCMPNASQTCVGDGIVMKIRALVPIAQGEEIFIAYIDLNKTTEERRRELEDVYKFTCQCERCVTTSASETLVLKEFNAMRSLDANKQRYTALLKEHRQDAEGIQEKYNEVLRLMIANFDLLKSFLPVHHSVLASYLLLISQTIFKRTEEALKHQYEETKLARSKKKIKLKKSSEVKKKTSGCQDLVLYTEDRSQWTEADWLSVTERHLIITHGRDHQEYVKFRENLEEYHQAKMLSGILFTSSSQN